MATIAEEFAEMSEYAANPAYQEGVTAFRDGKPDSACPYLSKSGKAIGDQRMIWMCGFFNARIKPLLDRSYSSLCLAEERPRP